MPRIQSITPGQISSQTNIGAFCFEGNKRPAGAFLLGSTADKALDIARKDGFVGKPGQVAVIHSNHKKIERFIFVGLGPEKDASLQCVRKDIAKLVLKAQELKLSSVAIRLPQIGNASDVSQAAAEGITLGLYQYTQYKSQKKTDNKPQTISFIAKDKSEQNAVKIGIQLGTIFGESTCLARDLINNPPSDLTPAHMVKKAQKLSGGSIKLRVFNKTQIEKMKMGGILGVNYGSGKPPFFLHLTYKPKGRVKRRIGICGKGITFDSGGLSLKPARAMETMKMDMAGSATVLAIFKALAKLKPNVEVQGFTPLTENMPGCNATKPGDVLTAMNGKTIEVLNTDAEGRLVLADALSYASKQNLDEVFDIATLTGACTVALGNSITGIMGTSPKMIEGLKKASGKSGEKVWELPLDKEYEAHIKSPVADIKNMGRPMQAGTIIGGIFLKEFVAKNLPWIHIDIASTAWSDSNTALAKVGATGSMVRTLLHYIMSYN